MKDMSSLTDRVSSTSKLNILVRTLLELALADIKAQGVVPLVLETYRSQQRQNYLYCQGRTVAEVTKKGISKTFAQKYCTPKASKVTWTLNSVHTINKAVDIIPQRKVNGKWTAIWNASDSQSKIIIATMQKYGFEAGVNWKTNPDSPHYQINGSYTTIFNTKYNTVYVTKVVQKALNSKIKAKLSVDGAWGPKTTAAVNTFRKKQGYKTSAGQLGSIALKALFK